MFKRILLTGLFTFFALSSAMAVPEKAIIKVYSNVTIDSRGNAFPYSGIYIGGWRDVRKRRALVYFDLSFVPKRAKIISAVLKCYGMEVYKSNPGSNKTIKIFKILKPWEFMDIDEQGMCRNVTWNHRHKSGSLPWGEAGAGKKGEDVSAAEYGSFIYDASANFKWYSCDVKKLVQEWLEGDNFGMMMRNLEAEGSSNNCFRVIDINYLTNPKLKNYVIQLELSYVE